MLSEQLMELNRASTAFNLLGYLIFFSVTSISMLFSLANILKHVLL